MKSKNDNLSWWTDSRYSEGILLRSSTIDGVNAGCIDRRSGSKSFQSDPGNPLLGPMSEIRRRDRHRPTGAIKRAVLTFSILTIELR